MLKRLIACVVAAMLACTLIACGGSESNTQSKSASASNVGSISDVKIGVVFGVGGASRWPKELEYMKKHAEELGASIETRLNLGDKEQTWQDDCRELIDGGINVLILTPRNTGEVEEVAAYARERNVRVLCYARPPMNSAVDLYVGYDSERLGQLMGQFLTELVYKGDYIVLSGAPEDPNSLLLYQGAMRFIEPLKSNINIILDESVPGWSADAAKQMVLEAVAANGNKIDGIFAPNDKIAGACAAALAELGVSAPVAITGMDAELEAIQRIALGMQSMTIYMDLKELSTNAVDEACKLAMGQATEVNSKFDNGTAEGVDARLITGKVVAKENLDKTIIDGGVFTREQVYGAAA